MWLDNDMSTTYTVHTQHGADREVHVVEFSDYDMALAHALANTPDSDGSMAPNVDDSYGDHPGYEKGCFWYGNRYAVVIKVRP